MGHFERGKYIKYDQTAQIPIQFKDGSWGFQIKSNKTTSPCEQYITGDGLIDVHDMPLDPIEKKLQEIEGRVKNLEGKKCGCNKSV